MASFHDSLDECELHDLGFSGNMFTWCNRRDQHLHVSLRLDQFLANADFLSLFPDFRVINRNWSKSNHRLIELLHSYGSHRRSLWFNDHWSSYEDCIQIVKDSVNWEGAITNPVTIQHKLEVCARNLQR